MNILDINPEKLSAGMRQYYDIKINHMDKIVFFQLGDFYEFFFDDAINLSKQIDLTLTKKAAGLEEKIPMAGVPLSTLDVYIKKVLDLNLSIVVVVQDDTDKSAKIVKRVIKKIITPGTYVDEIEADNNYSSAIKINELIELSYGDVATGQLFVQKFDNLKLCIDEIVNLNIKEVIDPQASLQKDLELLDYNNINIIAKYNQDMRPILEMDSSSDILLDYFDYVTCGKIQHFTKPVFVENDNYLKMSSQTMSQLELVKTLKEGQYDGSLFSYLNCTKTLMGKRYLKEMIIHPLIDLKEIYYRQDMVDFFSRNLQCSDLIQGILNEIFDFERLLSKISDGTISPIQVVKLKTSLQNINLLKEQLTEIENLNIFGLGQQIDAIENLQLLIEKTLIDNPTKFIKDTGNIKEGFNQEVDNLRFLKNNSTKWLSDFELKQRELTQIKGLKIKYNKIFGYFIEVTNNFLDKVPESYTRKQTMANCERYITDELKHQENLILNANDNLIKLETVLFDQLKLELKDYISQFKMLAKQVGFIDVIVCFGVISRRDFLVKPKFNDLDYVKLEDCFHPIVNSKVSNFIKNDVNFEESQVISLITGPNMAGKSTYMRQTVIAVIMAQMGCFVAAQKADLKLFDQIFTRIGASDDLAQGKSTFMVEMTETASCLNAATKDSLIIFDELGRGTSTYDGIALAQSIIEYIIKNIGAKTMFSTHYHELTQMDQDYKELKNIHVRAEKENGKLIFFHKIASGAVEKSYGVEVAKLANVPNEIVNRANVIIKELEVSHGEVRQLELDIFRSDIPDPIFKKKAEFFDDIDLNNLTPLDALNLLNEFKKL